MAEQHLDEEVVLSFYAALVNTIRRVEEAQPEPGFSALFMDLLDKQMERAIAGAKAEGLDIREPLKGIHRHLVRMFMAKDLGDTLAG